MRNSMDCAKKGLYQSTTSLITFYEDKNFQGRSYDTSSDCSELSSHLSRCNSFRVESGCFMVYERPNFKGPQKMVMRGDYPDHRRLVGLSNTDCIHSCRMIPMHRGQFRIRVYERENYQGQMSEMMDDCENTMERFHCNQWMSCNVMEGHWLMYEDANFRGRELYLGPGEYRNMNEMDTKLNDTRFDSIRRIMES